VECFALLDLRPRAVRVDGATADTRPDIFSSVRFSRCHCFHAAGQSLGARRVLDAAFSGAALPTWSRRVKLTLKYTSII
jgi:hypothetical protein